jgi:hypothetical protein
VDLDNLIINVFCTIDDAMKELFKGQKLRQRGPEPLMADSEVMTIEVVGESLGLSQDKAIFQYFRHHFTHFFPALGKIHRTTFTRQAANLWKVKEILWQYSLNRTDYDPSFAIVDSLPLPVCLFARAYRCRHFGGKAAFGKDMLVRQTFYGFRIHVRLCWPGVITRFVLAPGNKQELSVLPELVEGTRGLVIGDRNYWSPRLRESLFQEGIELQAPFRSAKRDPWPHFSGVLSRIRYLIDTVFSQLTERYQIKKVWAQDTWHLISRLLRKIYSHTLMLILNQKSGNPPLQFARLFP